MTTPTEALRTRVQSALADPACARLREWADIGPVQLAAVETLADLVAQQAGVQIAAWAMQLPGCDGSADWVEIGPEQPEPLGDFVPRALVWADELAGPDKAATWCAIHQHYKPCEHTQETAADKADPLRGLRRVPAHQHWLPGGEMPEGRQSSAHEGVRDER